MTEITIGDEKASKIIQIVSEYYNTSLDSLKEGDRTLFKIKVVHIIWYFCKIHTKKRYVDLAILLGRTSHCDIVHAVKSVKNQLDTNRIYRQEMSILSDRINRVLYPDSYAKNYYYYYMMSIDI